jgi:hypothetical protein
MSSLLIVSPAMPDAVRMAQTAKPAKLCRRVGGIAAPIGNPAGPALRFFHENCSSSLRLHSPPPERWQDHWGALVSDDSQGKLGVATDKVNEAGAWLAAEEDCHAKGGLNCTRLISYRNECIAMVLGDKTYSFSAGATASDAIRQATQKCMANTTNCHVYYTACSLPVRIQ